MRELELHQASPPATSGCAPEQKHLQDCDRRLGETEQAALPHAARLETRCAEPPSSWRTRSRLQTLADDVAPHRHAAPSPEQELAFGSRGARRPSLPRRSSTRRRPLLGRRLERSARDEDGAARRSSRARPTLPLRTRRPAQARGVAEAAQQQIHATPSSGWSRSGTSALERRRPIANHRTQSLTSIAARRELRGASGSRGGEGRARGAGREIALIASATSWRRSQRRPAGHARAAEHKLAAEAELAAGPDRAARDRGAPDHAPRGAGRPAQPPHLAGSRCRRTSRATVAA